MTDPKEPTVKDVVWSPQDKEQAQWLQNHKETTGLTWKELEKRIGRSGSTLSLFASMKYGAPPSEITEQVSAYRRLLVQQDRLRGEIPDIPDFYPTETSARIDQLLSTAQEGLITAGAFEAGLGKTRTARRYRDIYPNVSLATMRRSTGSVQTMLFQVLKAMGVRNATGAPQKLSEMVCEKASTMDRPLLIIDEAQHLSEGALEEARSWNDEVDLGIAFLGNAGVLQRMSRFPQLISRVSLRTHQVRPFRGDVEAMARAWDVFDAAQVKFLAEVCNRGGGLRRGTMVLRLATMLSRGQDQPLNVEHLKLAASQLYSDGALA